MTLATHMAIAAAVTKSFAQSHPILSFFAALATHYLSDAIPHWDYRLHAMQDTRDKEKEKGLWDADDARRFRARIVRDIRTIALDGFLGAGVILIIARPASMEQWLWVTTAIAGGALPDFLQGAYLAGARFLKPLQTLHDRMHTRIRLWDRPEIGIPSQLLIVIAAILFLI